MKYDYTYYYKNGFIKKLKEYLPLINCIGIVATVFMVGFIGWQSFKINQQTNIIKNSFVLENRPYLWVDIEPVVNFDFSKQDLYAGAKITYRNAGLFVASNIATEAKIADDSSNEKLLDTIQWYKDEEGSYPYIKSVFPKQEIKPIILRADVADFNSSNKKYIYFGIRITYKGFKDNEYYYGADYIYKLTKKGDNVFATVLKYDTYWDMNENLNIPSIKMPNWDIYKKSKK